MSDKPVAFSPDGWVGVGVVYDDDAMLISLYVNGVPAAKVNSDGKIKPQTSDNDLHLGVGVDNSDLFEGQIR